MGMYTEFYFRANIKDGPVADWLDQQINHEGWFEQPYDDHEFFQSDRWVSVFIGGGAVYQESRTPVFRRKAEPAQGEPYHHQLVLASSMKNYSGQIEDFIKWITPHLEMCRGEFLGYSLYEDSYDDAVSGWGRPDPGDVHREHPHLYFNGCDQVGS